MAQNYLSKADGDYAPIRSWNEQAEQTNEEAYCEHKDWLWAECEQAEYEAAQLRCWKSPKTRQTKLIDKRVNTNGVRVRLGNKQFSVERSVEQNGWLIDREAM